jgi:hypothetical protein
MIDIINNNIEILNNFGSHPITQGLAAYCFYCARNSTDISSYINYHEKQFLEKTSLNIKDLYISNKYGLYGKLYENNTQVVTPAMYRLGYIADIVKKYSLSNKRIVILEIGQAGVDWDF